jgi:hypothetical protein
MVQDACSGYDYLDTVRDPKVWSQTKSVLENIGGSAALEVVKEIAAKFMAELIRSFHRRIELALLRFHALSASWWLPRMGPVALHSGRCPGCRAVAGWSNQLREFCFGYLMVIDTACPAPSASLVLLPLASFFTSLAP